MPTTSNKRGTMSIWTSLSCIERISSSVCSCESRRERDHDALRRRSSRTSAGRSSVGPMSARLPLVAAMRVVAVDEARDPQPVLGMLIDLVRVL